MKIFIFLLVLNYIKPGQEIILTNNSLIISKSLGIHMEHQDRVTIRGNKNNFGGGLLLLGQKKHLFYIQILNICQVMY